MGDREHCWTIPPTFLDHVRARNYRPATDVDVSDAKFDAAIAAYF
ncbi:hypothetical protein [Nocardia sp. NPDC059228]